MKNVYVVQRLEFNVFDNMYTPYYLTDEVFTSLSKALEMVNYTIENEIGEMIKSDMDDDKYNTKRIDWESNGNKYRFVIKKLIVNEYDYSV